MVCHTSCGHKDRSSTPEIGSSLYKDPSQKWNRLRGVDDMDALITGSWVSGNRTIPYWQTVQICEVLTLTSDSRKDQSYDMNPWPGVGASMVLCK